MKTGLKKITAFLLCIVLIICFVYAGRNIFYKAVYPLKYETGILTAAQKFNLEPALIYGIIKTESNFDENARSHAQAIGLMQIVPETFIWLKSINQDLPDVDVNELTKPDINIMFGSCYLRYLLDIFKNEATAIAAYNAGPGNVSKWLKNEEYTNDGISLCNIPFPETEKYVKNVSTSKEMYINLYFNDNDKRR